MLVGDQGKLTQACPQCKTLVRSDAKFCHRCGLRFKEEVQAITCPKCKKLTRTAAKFCPICGRSLPDLKEGNQIGNYIVERLLGVGGIGAVYLSHHRLLMQQAALKIHDYFPKNEYVGRAFLRSSNYLSQLDHPNIVHLYDYGFQSEKAYQAIEYVDGPTFAMLRPQQQTKEWVKRCIEYFSQMLTALQHSHTCQYIDVDGMLRRGIIHGDIKPHNIFLDHNTDTVKLSDFMIPDVQAFLGIKEPDLRHLSDDTQPFGTPEYMAPEQQAGRISPQTDIYSLGVTMYQILTGYSPSSIYGAQMIYHNIPPKGENPYVPAWLSDLIVKATQRDQVWRFQTIADMIKVFQDNRDQRSLYAIPYIDSSPLSSGRHGRPAIGQFNNVVDSLNTTSQMELAEALKLLKEAIMASLKISPNKKQELIEIINQIGEEATKIVPNRTLLRIVSDGLIEALRAIPDNTLLRIVEGSKPVLIKVYKEQKNMSKMIRVLFLAANPKDTESLRLDEEMRGIDVALRQAEYRDRFDIKQQWAVRVSDLQGYLLRHTPDIVHFSGHGSPSSEIILEDNSGNSHAVSPRTLSQVFSILKDNIRCIVLNACYSEMQAQAIAQHIDCVIGMSRAIGDEAAIGFATAFYQALGYGRNVKTAFELGCSQIGLENLNEQDTPRLLAGNSNPATIVFADDNL